MLVHPLHSLTRIFSTYYTQRQGTATLNKVKQQQRSDEAMVWTIKKLYFDYRRGQEIFLFPIVSRMALGSIMPPIQWETWALS